jgi:outer membrane receptor protein involved in Fe transport
VTEYSNSGTVETWKIGVEWEPVDWLRFRGTRSRDIRAPNLFELYGAPQSSFQTVDDPANGGVRNLIPTLLGGNTTLQPEEADTWTVGGSSRRASAALVPCGCRSTASTSRSTA